MKLPPIIIEIRVRSAEGHVEPPMVEKIGDIDAAKRVLSEVASTSSTFPSIVTVLPDGDRARAIFAKVAHVVDERIVVDMAGGSTHAFARASGRAITSLAAQSGWYIAPEDLAKFNPPVEVKPESIAPAYPFGNRYSRYFVYGRRGTKGAGRTRVSATAIDEEMVAAGFDRVLVYCDGQIKTSEDAAKEALRRCEEGARAPIPVDARWLARTLGIDGSMEKPWRFAFYDAEPSTHRRAEFGGFAFPAEQVTVTGGVPTHEFPNGARSLGEVITEPTPKPKRRPYFVTMRATFKARIEGYQNLYPETHNALRATFECGGTHNLVVPSLGTLRAFATSWTFVDLPDGHAIDVTFCEDMEAKPAAENTGLTSPHGVAFTEAEPKIGEATAAPKQPPIYVKVTASQGCGAYIPKGAVLRERRLDHARYETIFGDLCQDGAPLALITHDVGLPVPTPGSVLYFDAPPAGCGPSAVVFDPDAKVEKPVEHTLTPESILRGYGTHHVPRGREATALWQMAARSALALHAYYGLPVNKISFAEIARWIILTGTVKQWAALRDALPADPPVTGLLSTP